MRQLIPSYEFRRRARVRMKPVLPILLVVALIAALPSLVSSVVMLMTDANPTTLFTDYINRRLQITEDESLTGALLESALSAVQEEYVEKMLSFLTEHGLLLTVLTLVSTVLSAVLNLGLINAYLHALRKKEFTPSIALSRMSSTLRVIGLELLIGLKVVAWMLPGLAACFAGALGMVLGQTTIGLLLIIAGGIAGCVMSIMATYRYYMAIFVLADDPSTGIRACIRRSKEAMATRKMELFSLEISFIGWRFLLGMAQELLLSLFGQVVGQTLGMFASLFLTVYVGCALTAFYQAYFCGREDFVEDDPDVADAENQKMTD